MSSNNFKCSPSVSLRQSSDIKKKILDAADLKRFYEKETSQEIIADANGGAMILCVFHEDKDASLSININTGMFHCFGCSESGSIFDFYMKRHGVDFKTALKELAAEAGIELSQSPHKKLTLPEKFQESLETDFPQTARDYLHGRGIIDRTADSLLDMGLIGFNPRAYAGKDKDNKSFYVPAITFPMTEYTPKWEKKEITGIQNIFFEPVIAFENGKAKKLTKRHEYGSKPSNAFFMLGDMVNSEYQVITESVINLISAWQTCKASGCAIFSTSHISKLKNVSLTNPLLFFDHDNAGKKATGDALNVLTGAKVVQWTEDYPNKYDVNDFLKDNRAEEIVILISGATEIEAKHPCAVENLPELPTILVNEKQLRDFESELWDALVKWNDPPKIYQNIRGIVEINLNKENHSLEIDEITVAKMRSNLAKAANWTEMRYSQNYGSYQVSVLTPKVAAESVLAEKNPPLPYLKKITCSPFFNRAGVLSIKPGYQPETQCFLNFHEKISRIPDRPSRSDMDTAKEWIDELLWDFPFVDRSEKANAIAFFLVQYVRELIKGQTPLHMFEASTPGTGKSLLVEMLCYPFLNSSVPAKSEITDNIELRKQITTSLIAKVPIIFFDNLNYGIDSGIIAGAATNPMWNDRLLGGNREVNLPVRCIWALSGNNPQMSKENLRRTVRIRQDARMEYPELRDTRKFRHPDIRGWVQTNRGHLIWAALVICQNWIAQGRPLAKNAPVMGSFEEWVEIMAGILECAGIEGFLGNAMSFREDADDETTALRAFISAWWTEFKSNEVTAKELFPLVDREGIPLKLTAKSDRGIQTQFGTIIKKLKDRRFNLRFDTVSFDVTVSKSGSFKNALKWVLMPDKDVCPECGCKSFWQSKSSKKWFCNNCNPPDDETDVADIKNG